MEIPTVIIGAGPAGLAVAGCLSKAKLPFVILEQHDRIGSVWHRHYERLHLHTAKQFSALPYMPYPKDYPLYPSRLQFIDYLEAYAKAFNIKPLFGQIVTSARREGDRWHVETQEQSYSCQNLVVATGYNQSPYIPSWPGMESFQGKMLHTSDYKTGAPFTGQKVLIIGFGNSGAEIAIDLWEHQAVPEISIRGSVGIVSRDLLGIPVQFLSILLSPLPAQIIDALTAPFLRLRIGNLQPYGIVQTGAVKRIRDQAKIPVIDVGTIRLIKQGHIRLRGAVASFTTDQVVFADGTAERFQTVIFATGYRPALDFIKSDSQTTGTNVLKQPGLYFCGFKNTATGLLREISIEAQRIARTIEDNSPS